MVSRVLFTFSHAPLFSVRDFIFMIAVSVADISGLPVLTPGDGAAISDPAFLISSSEASFPVISLKAAWVIAICASIFVLREFISI